MGMKMAKARECAMAVMVLIWLSGCGQKGDLYLPVYEANVADASNANQVKGTGSPLSEDTSAKAQKKRKQTATK